MGLEISQSNTSFVQKVIYCFGMLQNFVNRTRKKYYAEMKCKRYTIQYKQYQFLFEFVEKEAFRPPFVLGTPIFCIICMKRESLLFLCLLSPTFFLPFCVAINNVIWAFFPHININKCMAYGHKLLCKLLPFPPPHSARVLPVLPHSGFCVPNRKKSCESLKNRKIQFPVVYTKNLRIPQKVGDSSPDIRRYKFKGS